MTNPLIPQPEKTPASNQQKAVRPPIRFLKERYDGRAKVTGTARYAAEFPFPGLVHAFVVQSTIPNGAIASHDCTTAEQA